LPRAVGALLPRAAGAFDWPRETSSRDGGVKGRNPPPLFEGDDGIALRGDSMLLGLMFEEPMFGRPAPLVADGRVLLLGAVKGRNPTPLFAGADCVMPRCDCTLPSPIFLGLVLEPILDRPEFPIVDERVPLVGGLSGRNPPRFPFCPEDSWLTVLRFPGLLIWELFICRFDSVPALGRCMFVFAVVPRNPEDCPALKRPPAGTAPT